MTKIILVRHGETDWNQNEIFRGTIDVPLNARGLAQAEATGEALRGFPVKAVYASPLQRAYATGEKIAAVHNLMVQKEEGFLDLNFGAWQGLSRQEVQTAFPELYQQWQENPHLVSFPTGESLEVVRQRALAALKKLVKIHGGETFVIATHRVVCKVLICNLLGLSNKDFWRVRQDTCAVNIFEVTSRGYVVRLLNDTCHLSKMLPPPSDF